MGGGWAGGDAVDDMSDTVGGRDVGSDDGGVVRFDLAFGEGDGNRSAVEGDVITGGQVGGELGAVEDMVGEDGRELRNVGRKPSSAPSGSAAKAALFGAKTVRGSAPWRADSRPAASTAALRVLRSSVATTISQRDCGGGGPGGSRTLSMT